METEKPLMDRVDMPVSGLQAAAYNGHKRAPSEVASSQRPSRIAAKSLQDYNKALREAQMRVQKTKYIDREMSPLARDPENYETRLLNDNNNYGASPAAKRAIQDGSLDPAQTHFNRTFNRKLKMRDTFTKIFPSYTHAEPTCYIASTTHHKHYYPKQNDLGGTMQDIDRSYTHKMDFMKEYTESMLKIQNMRRF